MKTRRDLTKTMLAFSAVGTGPVDDRPVRPSPLATARELKALLLPYHQSRDTIDAATPKSSAVLLLPGMSRDDGQTDGLRSELGRHGYIPFGWGLGTDLGPTRRLMAGAKTRLIALSDAHGPVNLVGFSMGGLFARWLAAEHPGRVRHVITVCSPFRDPLDSALVPLRPFLRLWSAPGLDELASKLALPIRVPQTCIYSRNDGIVAWRSCLDPDHPGDCFAIDGQHVTAAIDPDVWAILLRRLALH